MPYADLTGAINVAIGFVEVLQETLEEMKKEGGGGLSSQEKRELARVKKLRKTLIIADKLARKL